MSRLKTCLVITPLPLHALQFSHPFTNLCTLLDQDLLFLGGCGQAFSAIIVSPLFEKKTTLAKHRLVNSALKAEVAAIHAWTPKCYTPEQWEKESGKAVAPGKATNGEVVNGTTA